MNDLLCGGGGEKGRDERIREVEVGALRAFPKTVHMAELDLPTLFDTSGRFAWTKQLAQEIAINFKFLSICGLISPNSIVF